ncbi:MAG TPA: phosphatidate cytidylyltransferase [Rhodocyclaceae bacterium]|nr:phosphatidate cytidylyltransferase [Rhodocyclaceae bacterium]
MLKTRILTALLLLVVFLLAVFLLPEKFFAVAVAVVVWFAVREWSLLLKMQRVQGVILQTVIALLVLAFGLADDSKHSAVLLTLIYLGAFSFWWATAPAFMYIYEPIEKGYWGYMTGVMIFVPVAVAFLELRHAGPWILLAAMAPIWLADIAAYSVGRAFGRHKLAPTISPGKSWEGVWGGLAAVIIYALVLRAFVPALAGHVGVFVTLLIAAFYAAMSVVGDLFESMMKRHAGVKDSGTLLPGHGGILDRIDSLLPTLPLAGALLLWMR